MVKKGLNKHPGGKKKPTNIDKSEIKKYIQAETGVVVSSIDPGSKTVTISKTADFTKLTSTFGPMVGGWTIKQG
ncbi:MAG: hypothetical protein ABI743_14060 [bacterium]